MTFPAVRGGGGGTRREADMFAVEQRGTPNREGCGERNTKTAGGGRSKSAGFESGAAGAELTPAGVWMEVDPASSGRLGREELDMRSRRTEKSHRESTVDGFTQYHLAVLEQSLYV